MFSSKQMQAGEYIKFGDTPIKLKTKVKYLGVTHFSSRIQNIITKANGAKFSLLLLLNTRSPLNINSK